MLLLYEHIPTALTQLQKLEHELIMHFWMEKEKYAFAHLKMLLEPTVGFVNCCCDRVLGI